MDSWIRNLDSNSLANTKAYEDIFESNTICNYYVIKLNSSST